MNKHPMLSCKEAAQIMGCDERWVRERLNQGQLKGEKRNIGLKEKWFVYAGEVEAIVANRRGNLPNPNSSEYLATPSQPQQNGPDSAAVKDSVVVEATWDDEGVSSATDAEDRLDWLQNQRQAVLDLAEEMMRPLITQLDEKSNLLKQKEDALQAATFQLGYAQGRLQEQEEKIKLLPDFQARAEQAEQVKQEAEAAKARAVELEQHLEQVEKSAKEEILRISEEKDQLTKSQQAELEALKTRISGLERSWWKKFFGIHD